MEKKEAQAVQMRGVVVFMQRNAGSKSEGIYPFLYQNRESCLRLCFAGDNPFENPKLVPYDGMPVEVRGVIGVNHILIVEGIAPLLPEKAPADSPETEKTE